MSAYLFAAHPTVGHTQALRAVGRALLARGHRVRFAVGRPAPLPSFLPAPAALRSAQAVLDGVAGDGFTRIDLPLRLRTGPYALMIARSRGFDELGWALRLFTDDLARTAQRLVSELEREPADVVVGDCFHYPSALAAELRGLPFAAFFHSGLPFPVPGGLPFGSPLTDRPPSADELQRAEARLELLVARADRVIAEARQALGLPHEAPRLLGRPYADLNVLTSFEAFEEPRPALADSAAGPILWAGPCLGTRPTVPFPWERLEGGPNVYVSLGTVFNEATAVYRALIAGVHGLGEGARAVVSAGASLEALRAVVRPRDVLVSYAPQLELLAKVDAAIVHGGNNSTNEALRAGTPLAVVPFGGEQAVNARRAVRIAGAEAIPLEALSAERVTGALRKLLTPAARSRARALAASVPEEDGVPRVVHALEALAR